MTASIAPGLADAVRRARERASAAGVLAPIATRIDVIDDGGVRFVIRVVSSLVDKPRAIGQRAPGANPFLPPDPAVVVGDVSPTHLCVLNRFPVFDGHALIITRRFEPQESALTVEDLAALLACMDGMDGLGFYNAGAVAGASQPHKHLQLVPTPVGTGRSRTPVDDAVRAGTLPFAHAAADFEPDPVRAHTRYEELLREAGCNAPGAPYNLLVTRDWQMVVPRSRERVDGVSVNALGFAGSLLARDHDELETIRRIGPMQILVEVS